MRDRLASLGLELADLAEARWPRAWYLARRYGFGMACGGFALLFAAALLTHPVPDVPATPSDEELRYLAAIKRSETTDTGALDRLRLDSLHMPLAEEAPRGPRRRKLPPAVVAPIEVRPIERVPAAGTRPQRRQALRIPPGLRPSVLPPSLQADSASEQELVWIEPPEVRQQRMLGYVEEALQRKRSDSSAAAPLSTTDGDEGKDARTPRKRW